MAEIIGLGNEHVTALDQTTKGRGHNVVADHHRNPSSRGWITNVKVHAGGDNTSTTARIGAWRLVEGSFELVHSGAEQIWNAQKEWRSSGAMTPIRTDREDVWRFGFMHADLQKPIKYSLRPANQHRVMTWNGLGLPPVFDVQNSLDDTLIAHAVFVRNEAPLRGAWRSPMPTGQVTDPNIVYSGTLPHPGEGVMAIKAGDVRANIDGDVEVDPDQTAVDKIAYVSRNDEEAMIGPRGAYEVTNLEKSSIVTAQATHRVQAALDGALDYSSLVQVQVVRDQSNQIDTIEFEPTEQENAQGWFARQLYALTPGIKCKIRFRHLDSWGVTSPWSDWNNIDVLDGPLVPTIVSPLSRINAGTGIVYRFTHGHIMSTLNRAKAVRIRIYNDRGSSLISQTTVTFTSLNYVAVGSDIVVNQWHAALTVGRGYKLEVRVMDEADRWGPASRKYAFRVNQKPNTPSNLRPSGGGNTANDELRCKVSDPDGDPIVAVECRLYVVNSVTGVATLLTGYPKPMTLSADASVASRKVAADMIAGSTYRWEARAYDGVEWSSWSLFSQFRYVALPIVSIMSPKEGGITNLVPQPSAEYDPAVAGNGWTEVGRVEGVRYINRTTDGDASWGLASWEAVTDGGAVGHYLESLDYMPVVAAVHHVALGQFKTKAGNPASRFSVVCYSDNSAVPLGEVVPSTNDALDGTTPTLFWSDYGGSLWPSSSLEVKKMPVGTTRCKLRWRPSVTVARAGRVRMDALFFASAPSKDEVTWQAVREFWGYMDANSEWFGEIDDRTWTATPGNSTSRGPNVLTDSTSDMEFSYVSPASQNSAKVAHKILVERWFRYEQKVGTPGGGVFTRYSGRWRQVYATTYQAVATPSTRASLPSNVVRNQGRYRTKIWVKDALGNEGESEWVEFDVLYEGPPELGWIQVNGDRDRAELVGIHTQSGYDPNQLKEIQYEVTPENGDTIRIVQENAFASRFVYPYPVSGVRYQVKVRQVVIIAGEEVESKWQVHNVAVDYFPKFFLKRVTEPVRLNIPFVVPGDSPPGFTPKIPSAAPLTWGSKKPKPASGSEEYETGSVTMALWKESIMSDEEKLSKMREMVGVKRGTMCLLSHKPTQKRFIAFQEDGAPIEVTELLRYHVNLAWTEVEWDEDDSLREGSG